MSTTLEASAKRTVGLREVPLALLAPRRVFRKVEDVPAYAWPLVALLALVSLIGYATVETGLIDREVQRSVRTRIAAIDAVQRNVVERSALRDMYAEQEQQGEFEELLTRIRVVVAEPLKAAMFALLIAAILFGMVAISGRKPEWHTLLTVCVFAGFVEALRLVVELGLMLRHGALDVNTSAAVALPLLIEPGQIDGQAYAGLSGFATVLDPFRIWYWLMIYIGVTTTSQLTGWRAWLVCVLGWLVGGGLRAMMAVALVNAGMTQ